MNGFIKTISDLLMEVGVREDEIYVSRGATYLPGYFRPTKSWDIVVVHADCLIAVIELKSQAGSFGNNFNNRTEEAMGSALDLWTAYREGAFSCSPAPWLGYLILLSDCQESRSPVSVREPHFPVFSEFQGASYADRFEIFCRKIVRERHYNSACLLLADSALADREVNYWEPAEDLSATQFLGYLRQHVRAVLG